MTRSMWVLLGWSPEYGAAVTAVGVLGIDVVEEDVEVFVEWVPREPEAAQVWRRRLATASSRDVVSTMPFWAETPVASAAAVEPLAPAAGLEAAVRAQVDDLLGSAR